MGIIVHDEIIVSSGEKLKDLYISFSYNNITLNKRIVREDVIKYWIRGNAEMWISKSIKNELPQKGVPKKSPVSYIIINCEVPVESISEGIYKIAYDNLKSKYISYTDDI